MKKIQNSIVKIQSIGTLFLASLLFPVLAFASGGEMINMSTMDWVWKIVNFAVLVVGLYWFVFKYLKAPEFLKERKELIEKSITEAREAKEMASKTLAEVESKLKLKDKEISAIISAAVETGEREKQRLIEEGEKMKARIIEQAKTNIEVEVKKAKQVIQAEAVEASLKIAEEKIKSRMTAKEQDRLLQESIKMIEGKN
jgi:F-type H+-transporting ATPase subunit b